MSSGRSAGWYVGEIVVGGYKVVPPGDLVGFRNSPYGVHLNRATGIATLYKVQPDSSALTGWTWDLLSSSVSYNPATMFPFVLSDTTIIFTEIVSTAYPLSFQWAFRALTRTGETIGISGRQQEVTAYGITGVCRVSDTSFARGYGDVPIIGAPNTLAFYGPTTTTIQGLTTSGSSISLASQTNIMKPNPSPITANSDQFAGALGGIQHYGSGKLIGIFPGSFLADAAFIQFDFTVGGGVTGKHAQAVLPGGGNSFLFLSGAHNSSDSIWFVGSLALGVLPLGVSGTGFNIGTPSFADFPFLDAVLAGPNDYLVVGQVGNPFKYYVTTQSGSSVSVRVPVTTTVPGSPVLASAASAARHSHPLNGSVCAFVSILGDGFYEPVAFAF